jgi:hypothetical protein
LHSKESGLGLIEPEGVLYRITPHPMDEFNEYADLKNPNFQCVKDLLETAGLHCGSSPLFLFNRGLQHSVLPVKKNQKSQVIRG